MAYDARAVANCLLDMADKEGRQLDHMSIQKLVYIAHGWHLAITDNPLIYNRIEAWEYGPVIPSLYHELKGYGPLAIKDRIMYSDPDTGEIKPLALRDFADQMLNESMEVINAVWHRYGNLSSLELSSLTHQSGTPWEIVRRGNEAERGLLIPDTFIREHYRELAQKRRSTSNVK